MPEVCDILIIGAGFFGISIGEHFARTGHRVVVLEQSNEAMTRASYSNQARIHNGYHYPRSFRTAYRSHVNFPRFCGEYRDAVVSDFKKLYAVPRLLSKVTARQFKLFMERVGSPIARAAPELTELFNPLLIEDVFEVTEYAFDALILRQIAVERLESAGGKIRYSTTALSIGISSSGLLVRARSGHERVEFLASKVFNATYGRLNSLNQGSGLPLIPLKNELTEMALVKAPEKFKKLGITVMCGPFFSIMPFPPRCMHTLSHVRYTPHCWWKDEPGESYRDSYEFMASYEKKTRFTHMMHDAARYIPGLQDLEYHDSIWEIKTILPLSEVDDSRPILFKADYQLPGYTCVMGGKIDNVYDAIAECDSAREERNP